MLTLDRATGAQVSGETYSRLINLAGRRRFTSQRVVLFAVLAAQGRGDALAVARDALATLKAAHHALTQGADGLPGLFCPELREAHHGGAGHEAVIQDFLALAQGTLDAIAGNGRSAPALLDRLVETATPMLAAVNALTQVYEDLARRHARQEREKLLDLLVDIQQIAKQAKIVSFNAQVVAARSSSGGEEFSQVAGELLRITTRIDDLVHQAVRSA